MLLALALIPVVGLLLFIYFKDKNEKEPFGLLIGLFFAGMSTITSAIILESIGEVVLRAIIPPDTSLYYIVLSFIVIGPAEELGKFIVLRLLTWHNGHFDYSYDAIVYAVFVSLGFAALENIGYVFNNGIGTAILRMFTSIPGHAGFAVFMGFFYGRSKYAKVTNKPGSYTGNTLLAIFVPIIGHGIYDAIVMGGNASSVSLITGFSILLWIGYVIALYVVCIIIIIKSSRNDFCFVNKPAKPVPAAPVYTQPAMYNTSYQRPVNSIPAYMQQSAYMQRPARPYPVYTNPQAPRPQPVKPAAIPVAATSWTCVCSAVNNSKFCVQCGRMRPSVSNNWSCPRCMTLCKGNFCASCGTARPH